MKTLITGITGFTGPHLARLLLKREKPDRIYGVHRRYVDRLWSKDLMGELRMIRCDIEDPHDVERMLNEVKPDLIFHLAAYATVASSFDHPVTPFRTNVLGTMNLLEAVKRSSRSPRILIPGTAEEYGRVEQEDMPIEESHSLNPQNPYGISKVAQELVSLHYHKTFGLDVYLTRTFYTVGPGQPRSFVCSSFAGQIADIEEGKQKDIRVGNLSAKRDFIDIRDVVSAYVEIVENGKPGTVYNVCRADSISIETVLDTLLKKTSHSVDVVVDKARLRPLDVPDFVGDNSRIKSDTGWMPRITIEEALKDVLDYWRDKKNR